MAAGMATRSTRGLRWVARIAVLGCSACPAVQPAGDHEVRTIEPVPAQEPAALPSWSGVSWTPAGRLDERLRLELARDALSVPAPASSERATADAWRSYARIGPSDAPLAFLQQLAQGDPSPALLAAVGLLEPLPAAAGEAVQPIGEWVVLERDLWTRLAVADDLPRFGALAFSIGRIGGRSSQRYWATALAVPEQPEDFLVAAFDALSIACSRRHPLHPDTLGPLAAAIDGESPAVRVAALGALGRCAVPSAESFSERDLWVKRLERVTTGDDLDSARLAWKALAALGERPAVVPDAVLGPVSPGLLVEVEAVRALAGHIDTRGPLIARLATLTPPSITGDRTIAVWTALQSLRRAVDASPDAYAPLAGWRDRLLALTPTHERHRVELAVVTCELQVLAVIGGAPLGDVEHCADGVDALPEYYGEALAIEALLAITREAQTPARAAALLERAKDHRPQIAAAALAALADVEDPQVNAVLRDALVRADPGVLAAAAGAIAARAVDRDRRDPEVVAALETLLRTADTGYAVEARIAAIEALGGLARSAGEDVTERGGAEARPVMTTSPNDARKWLERAIVPLATDRNDAIRRAAWGALEGFDAERERFAAAVPRRVEQPFAPQVAAALEAYLEHPSAGLRVHTAIGVFEIEFAGAPTPIAAANLVSLAKAGYFDGLRFHRLVPGFVTQGGDPHGDGYGGPGWVVPCEWSDLQYQRGTVGMALAGKDTGGSQFFIAHTRLPHLDGRFTVVGHVRIGMEVVDRLLPFEQILRIEDIEFGAEPR